MANEDEDYGDYVTRCICGFTHDDGYMICCDGCLVWQHVECMKVDPKNLPEKYLCEQCEPRPVEKKRAKLLQIKKKEEMSDFDEDESADDKRRSGSSSPNPHAPIKRRKKQAHRTSSGGSMRVQELKAEARRTRKEKGDKEEGRRGKKKSKYPDTPTPPHSTSIMSGLQTLLTAASALEEQQLNPSIQHVSNDLWNSSLTPWRDPYESININHYTDILNLDLNEHLSQLEQEAVVYSIEDYNRLGPYPLCLVRDVAPSRKGLVSEAHIPEDEMILEYKGRITVKHALLEELGTTNQLLWKQKPCPFIYQYDKMSDIIVCIDARKCGNTARFIRRSCSPNAEVRHFFVNNEVHFGVYAINHVSPEEEITLPYDFPHDKCDYIVECACGQLTSCLISNRRTSTKIRERRGLKTDVSYQEEELTISKKPNIMRGHVLPTHTLDEDSNSSWTSTGSFTRKRLKRTCSQTSMNQQTSRDPTDSDSEEQDNMDNETPKRRKSREERKTEAIWKMFEKMEATRQKRQQHLSEGSHDGDTSPSTHYGTPKSGIKDRRTSSNSRKVQLLSSGKPRLSSVSSVDLLSPEPPDAFSPPLTPSLTLPPSSFHDLTYPTDSSLISPPFSTLPKLSFEVTPYLHPKYLLADFALPRKKAILRQWEMEQREAMSNLNDSNYTNGNNNHWMMNGFALACVKAMEGYKPRQRGCLKHRWMDMHKNQLQHDNNHTNIIIQLPHKKHFLKRWQEKENISNITTSTSSDPIISTCSSSAVTNVTSCSSSSSSSVSSTCMSVTDLKSETNNLMTTSESGLKPVLGLKPKPLPNEAPTSVPSSPLFDDFSDDDEFEEISKPQEKERLRRNGETHKIYKEDQETIGDIDSIESGSCLLDNETCHDNNSIVITSTCDNQFTTSITSGTITRSVQQDESFESVDEKQIETTTNNNITDSNTVLTDPSEIGSGNIIEQKDSSDMTLLNPVKIEGEDKERDQLEGIENMDIIEVSEEEDNQDTVEMDISSSPPPPPPPHSNFITSLDSTTDDNKSSHQTSSYPLIQDTTYKGDKEIDDVSPIKEKVPEDSLDLMKGEVMSGNDKSTILSSYNEGVILPGSKPAAKRKMSLFEYRNRARKPSEQQQQPRKTHLQESSSSFTSISSTPPSITITSTSSIPPVTSPSVSFLSFSSSFLSSSSNRGTSTSVGSPPSMTRLSESGPHFEPVSPDEGDRTPLADEGPVKRVPLSSQLPPPPPPPPPHSSSTNLMATSTMSYGIPLTPTVMTTGQQFFWGHPSTPLDMTQDPRRVIQPSTTDIYLHHPHQAQISPQDMIHTHFPTSFNPMMPPPPPQQIITPPGTEYIPRVPHASVSSGVFVPHTQLPHPSMIHPNPPHHSNNNYY